MINQPHLHKRPYFDDMHGSLEQQLQQALTHETDGLQQAVQRVGVAARGSGRDVVLLLGLLPLVLLVLLLCLLQRQADMAPRWRAGPLALAHACVWTMDQGLQRQNCRPV
jgi:hypothetical protein